MNECLLANNGRTNWQICNVSSTCKVSVWALGELKRYLGKITNCDFPVSTKEASETRFPAVFLGLRVDLPAALSACLPEPAKGYDGYTLSLAGDKVVIAGDNERGIVYGVYEFLERLGCRWFYPSHDPMDPEVVPYAKTLNVSGGSKAVASPIRIRICNASSFFFEIEPERMKKQLDVAMKSRYNGMGWQCDHRSYVGDQYQQLVETGVMEEIKNRGMMFHGPAHSFQHFLKTEDYFEEHPAWFGMRDGKRVKQEYGGAQFCWSNPEARKVFIDNAEQFVLDSPGLDIFCTLGFDGGPCCECPECQKSTPANLVFLLMNELLERLQNSARKVIVETSGGYNPVHEPPDKTEPHENLRVVWAHWGRYMGYGYDDDTYPWKENLEKWLEAIQGRLTLCQYYTDNFATPWVSAPYAVCLEGDKRYILEKQIDGIYMLVYPKGYWWNHALNQYLAGQCFYDASLDPYEVIRDYAMHYFGQDAGPLLASYYEQWAREVNLAYRVKDDSTDSERAMLAEQRRKWIEPASSAVANDPVFSHRVAKVEKLHGAAERLTEAHRYHDEIVRLRQAKEFENAAHLLEKAKEYTDRLIEHLASLAALDIGLIDRKEVPNFMTMQIKEWIGREEKAIQAKSTVKKYEESQEPDSMDTLPTEVTET